MKKEKPKSWLAQNSTNFSNSKLRYDGEFTKILGQNKGIMILEDVGTWDLYL